MNRATIHFFDELKDFLPRQQRQQPLVRHFDWRSSVKDMIESQGVPHAEIELLLVNGHSVDFSYIVQDDDVIEVYPRFDAIEHPHKIRLRPALDPESICFILDTHLGRLAAYLRMMGFDTLYRNDYPDAELAEVSAKENRVLLTRDVGLLKRSIVVYGYFVRELKPKRRLMEVMQRFDLAESTRPFKHCMKCNGLLHTVKKDNIIEQLSPDIATFYDTFHQCDRCQQIYWKGAHYERMCHLIDEVMAEGVE